MFIETAIRRPTQVLRGLATSTLSWIPDETVCPILTGRLRGKKWIIGSSRKACWLGIYESHFQDLLRAQLKSSMVFYDIGANVGFYSLLASGILQSGTIYSFEPVPRNVDYLRRHVRLNHAGNVHVMDIAVSNYDGQATFQDSVDHASGHLGPGELQVNTRSMDSLLASQEILTPDCMKIDVEGEELKVLLGARTCLTLRKPTILLATHSEQLHTECRNLLESLGYTLTAIKTLDEGRADLLATPKGSWVGAGH